MKWLAGRKEDFLWVNLNLSQIPELGRFVLMRGEDIEAGGIVTEQN